MFFDKTKAAAVEARRNDVVERFEFARRENMILAGSQPAVLARYREAIRELAAMLAKCPNRTFGNYSYDPAREVVIARISESIPVPRSGDGGGAP